MLSSVIHEIFEQNFYHHFTVYLVAIVRKWTYEHGDEKAQTFS